MFKAIKKELDDHTSRKHWKVMSSRNVPSHTRPLPMVWVVKYKQNPIGKIIKWKARLCAGGCMSKEFIDYWDMNSPVVSWQIIKLFFAVVNK